MDVTTEVLVLFLLLVIGYIARRMRAIDEGAIAHFSSFILNITLPALILGSLQRPFSRELLSASFVTLLLSFAIYAAAILLSWFYPNLIRAPRGERGAHRYALIFSNVGFMGFPVVGAVLGGDALFLLAIFNVAFNLLAFSFGAWLIAGDGSKPLKLDAKVFVNPSVLATLIGFVAFLLSIRYPPFLQRAVTMVGDITSPLSMIVIGAILARMDARRILGRWRTWVTSAIRLIALPALCWAILWALGVRGLLLTLPVIVLAMPVAANTTILAEVYGGDVETASALVFISTLFCVLTIPAVALFIQR